MLILMPMFVLMLTSYTWNAGAYTFKESNIPISSEKILKEASKLGLSEGSEEIVVKKDIRRWSEKQKKEHINDVAPDTLVLEATHQKDNIGQAKIIARYQIYHAVQKHWDKLKDSSLNETAAPSFAQYEPYLKRDLDKIQYINVSDKKGHLFSLPWADVRVDSKLKKASWVIRIASHLDGNRLQEGAKDIVIPSHDADHDAE